jgi:hypothetical protein
MNDDYFLPTNDLEVETLLSDWRWLIGDGSFSIQAVAAVGNLFLSTDSGRIYLLEIEYGSFECVAESAEEFEGKLADRHNRRFWLRSYVVRELRTIGVHLGPGQCYGFKIPLHLGGGALAKDVEPIDLVSHLSILGQLHRQTRNGFAKA